MPASPRLPGEQGGQWESFKCLPCGVALGSLVGPASGGCKVVGTWDQTQSTKMQVTAIQASLGGELGSLEQGMIARRRRHKGGALGAGTAADPEQLGWELFSANPGQRSLCVVRSLGPPRPTVRGTLLGAG